MARKRNKCLSYGIEMELDLYAEKSMLTSAPAEHTLMLRRWQNAASAHLSKPWSLLNMGINL